MEPSLLSMRLLTSRSALSRCCFSWVWKWAHSAASFFLSSAQCCITDFCSSNSTLWKRRRRRRWNRVKFSLPLIQASIGLTLALSSSSLSMLICVVRMRRSSSKPLWVESALACSAVTFQRSWSTRHSKVYYCSPAVGKGNSVSFTNPNLKLQYGVLRKQWTWPAVNTQQGHQWWLRNSKENAELSEISCTIRVLFPHQQHSCSTQAMLSLNAENTLWGEKQKQHLHTCDWHWWDNPPDW